MVRWLIALSVVAQLAACAEDRVAQDLARLRDGDPLGRRLAAEALGRVPKDPRAVAPLIAALRDQDADVRCAAAVSLGALDAREAVEPMLALLREQAPGHGCTIEPLGQLGDARAVAPLLERRGDGAARRALGELGTVAVGPVVEALAKPMRQPEAIELGEVLARADPATAYPRLLAMLGSPDRHSSENAALALGGLGDPRAVEPLLAAFRKDNGGAGRALALLGGAALPGLDAYLRDRAAPRREVAAAFLGQTHDPAVIPILEAGVVDADPVVAQASARALANLAGARLDIPAPPGPDFPLHAPAAALLEARWRARDLRAIAFGMDYFERSHRDDAKTLIAALDAHGDIATATVLLNSNAMPLRDGAARWGRQRGLKPCHMETGRLPC